MSDPERKFAPDFLTELFRNPLDPGYAAAARRRQRGQAPTGWRLVTVRAVSLVTLVALGFLLAVAYRQTMAAEPSRSQVRAGLVEQIKQQQAESDDLARKAEELRQQVARQRDAALPGGRAARLRELEAMTGLGRVRGDGVVVRVADAETQTDAVTGKDGVNLGRVLDRDLQEIANGLWSAGAEAVAINGQRLTATSPIRAAGGAILVGFRPIMGPYEVSAIGPKELEQRFQESAAARLMRAVAAEYGMSFEVRAVDDLTLPGVGAPRLDYARPSPDPAATSSGSPSGSPSFAPSTPGGAPSSSGGGR